jgi:hypothetical protein
MKSQITSIVGAALLISCAAGTGEQPNGGGANALCTRPTFVKPAGHASVLFEIDATAIQGAAVANARPAFRRYADGDMQWKGSFIYDARTNVAAYDASWAAERGPFPPMYDDGPICEGGHEAPGAVKGDGKFSTEVYVKPGDADQVFEYGAVNEFGNWIWEGANGTFTVKALSTDTVTASGYKFHVYGQYNLKVTLDTATMHADFKPFDPTTQTVWLKGSMNSWTPVQLRDDGQKGDESAGDGVYTYEHRANLGAHDGMLYDGQHAQFTFVFNSAEGMEYKAAANGLTDGVKAFLDYPTPGTWREVTIALERESRRRAQNTAVVVGNGAGGGGGGGGGSVGDGGTGGGIPEVLLVEPPIGPTTGGTAIVVTGMRFAQGATLTLGGAAATEVVVVSETEIRAKTPSHVAGAVDVVVTNPGNQSGTYRGGFSFTGSLAVTSLNPDRGSPAGGTTVTIAGVGFEDGVTVKFGDAPAVDVQRRSATEIVCKAPAHALGGVDVVVKNPDNASALKRFTYAATVGWATIQFPAALNVTAGAQTDHIYARVYVEGVTAGAGRGVGVKAQAGFGAAGGTPDGSWTWVDAEWNADDGNNDEYRARLTPPAAGTFDVAFRFSADDGATWLVADRDGTTNGYAPAQATKLTVAAQSAVSVSAVSPDFVSVATTTSVTITGAGFATGATVTFGGVPATNVQVTSATTLTATTPKRTAGRVAVEVTVPSVGAGSKADAFAYVARIASAPTADGALTEWTSDYLVATQNAACVGSWGASNALTDLYFAYDDTNIYIAVRGKTETATSNHNAIVLYLDTDYASGQGRVLSDLSDKVGTLDTLISGTFAFADASFRPDFAAATRDMTSVAAGACSENAGVRAFANPADFGWVCTGVSIAGSTTAVEMTIPRAEVNPTSRGALSVLLTNASGSAYSNESLPAKPGTGCTGSAPVFVFDLK